MYTRQFKNPNHSFFLFGPRGTGKSTWIRKWFTDAILIDLLRSENFQRFSAKPSAIENEIPLGYSGWVILDEVQRVPMLLNEVHRLMQEKKLQFVLTGSSARKLRKEGTNLLAGRAWTYNMHPLIPDELKEDFELSKALKHGLLPDAYTSSSPYEYLRSYVGTYLQEEIKHEGFARHLDAFSRFLEAASFSQGNVLNVTEVARECSVERKTVENYFSILEDLLIAVRIPSFSKRAQRKVVSHPKFYFFDTGVFRTIRPRGPLDSPEEIEGAALETLVMQCLRAMNDYEQWNYKLHFWRTHTGKEVDFVLYGERGIVAIEVKRKAQLSSKDFRGLKAFLKDYPMSRALMLYGGDRELSEGDQIRVVPIDTFLKNMTLFLE